MQKGLRQGDIIKVEYVKHPVLVVSKDFFNASGQIIGCPIVEQSSAGPLHIYVQTDAVKGYVQCEKLALLDLRIRGHKMVDSILLSDRMNIADAIQGIFEYI